MPFDKAKNGPVMLAKSEFESDQLFQEEFRRLLKESDETRELARETADVEAENYPDHLPA